MRFVHLHTHTEYSLLDGSNKIRDYVRAVKEMGMDSAAITDHGVMYGVIDFYEECRKQGIRPILGCEVYVAPGSRFDRENTSGEDRYYHLILLAMNENGSANTMITLAGFSDLTQGIMNNMESVSEIEDFLTDRHLEEYRNMYEESDDAELLSIEKIPLLIGGEEKNAVKIHVIEGGVEQYILIWLYYKDGHMYMVWTASGGEDLVEGFLGNYYRDQSEN